MFWYIITENPATPNAQDFYAHQLALEAQADDHCLSLRFDQVSPALVAEMRPWAIVHSGAVANYDEFDFWSHTAYLDIITGCDVAQLGICGAHQFMAVLFGGQLGPIRPLRPVDPDLRPSYHPGYYKEWGMFPVRIEREDPLFAGLGETIRVQQYHMNEVKVLPDVLIPLASSRDCPVQACVHRERPVYGVQFHPEAATDAYPDGRRLLRNFFTLAREYAG